MAITITDGEFEALSGVVLEALVGDAPSFNAFSTKFKTGFSEDDVCLVPIYSDAGTTPDAFNETSKNYEDESTDGITMKAVTLDQHLTSTFKITDRQAAKVNKEEMMRIHTLALIRQAQIYVGGLITNANFGAAAHTGLASAFDTDDMIDLWTAAQTANFGPNRSCVLTTAYIAGILKDNDVKNWQNSNSTDPLIEAKFPKVAGFNIYEMKHLPGNSENLVGVITDKSGIALGSALIEPQGDTTKFMAITDPMSDLTVGLRSHYSDEKGALFVTVECLFGAAVGQAGGLKRIVSA